MKKITNVLAVALASLAVIGTASAAQTGGYIGAGLGYGNIQTPSGSFLSTTGATSASNSNTTGGLGGRIFTGYNFNRFFGAELGWTDFTKSTSNASVVTAGGTTSAHRTAQMNEVDLVGKAYLPIPCANSEFNLYALGGVAQVNETNRVYTTPAASTDGSTTVHKFRPKYGIGASYDVTPKVTTALELTRVQGNGNINTNIKSIPSANMGMLTVAYNFN